MQAIVNAKTFNCLCRIVDDIRCDKRYQSKKANHFYNVARTHCLNDKSQQFVNELNSMSKSNYDFDNFSYNDTWLYDVEICAAIMDYYTNCLAHGAQ